MRVISGVARGTKLKTVSGTELVRPTTDKVKGAIFNMIQFSVPGAKVLDLFCGSGALGIEALSRGAESVTFVDLSPKSLGVTEENLLHTHLMEKAELKKSDWESFLKQNSKQYSLVLADPPYAMDVLFKLLDCCAELIVPEESWFLNATDSRKRYCIRPFLCIDIIVTDALLYWCIGEVSRMAIAVYPGSFDPVTNGHLDIIERSAKIFDRLIVAVLRNRAKNPAFTIEEKIEMLQLVTQHLPNVEIDTFDGLLVDYAEMKHAQTIIKGLRAVSDFEYELQMAMANRKQNPEIETLFMMTNTDYSFLSSSIVRELAYHNGKLEGMIPEQIMPMIYKKLSKPKGE